jgi:hypothetical protein
MLVASALSAWFFVVAGIAVVVAILAALAYGGASPAGRGGLGSATRLPRFLNAARNDSLIVAVVVIVCLLVAVFVAVSLCSDCCGSGSGCASSSDCAGDEAQEEDERCCAPPANTMDTTLYLLAAAVVLCAVALVAFAVWRAYAKSGCGAQAPVVVAHPPPLPPKSAAAGPARPPANCPCASDATKTCSFGGVVSSTVAAETVTVPTARAPALSAAAPSDRTLVSAADAAQFSRRRTLLS